MSFPKHRSSRLLRCVLPILLAVPAILLFLSRDVASKVHTGFDVERVILGDDSRGPFLLGVSGLIEGSDSVWVDGKLLTRHRDYHLRVQDASLELTEPLMRGQRLRFTANRSLQVLSVIRRRDLPSESQSHIVTTVHSRRKTTFASAARDDAGAEHGIAVSGVKRLQVAVGTTSEAALTQSLRIELSGQLSDDVRVTGFLTDRNLPVQASGRSRSVQDLDRVHLEVASPRFSAGLGDVSIDYGGTSFSRYHRQLQGARFRMNGRRGEADLFGAVSEGAWETRRITTRPGYQGPYVLSAGTREISAGSERLFLNGIPLRRGEGQDYVIDYDRGHVTFTPGRPITGESRLTAEFQTVDPAGQIRSLGFRGQLETGDDRVRIGTTVIRESRGTGVASQVVPGAQPVAGTPDALLSSIDGAYRPIDGLRVEGELAWTRSGTGVVAPEAGHAAKVAMSWVSEQAREQISGPGAVSLSGSFRHVGQRFRPMDRLDAIADEGDWGWETGQDVDAGVVSELSLQYVPLTFASISGHVGRRTGALAGERYGSRVDFDGGRFGQGLVSFDRLRRNGGSIDRFHTHASGTLGPLRPLIRLTSESAEGSAIRGSRLFYARPTADLPGGARVREVEVSNEVGSRRLSLRSAATVTQIDQFVTAWSDSAREWTHHHQLNWATRTGLQFSGAFGQTARRDRVHEPVRLSNLGRVQVGYRPGHGVFSQEVQYQVSNTGIADRDQVYVEVPDGDGSYVWEDVDGDGERDPEEFVPETGGNFEPYYGLSTSFDPVRASSVGSRSMVDLGRGRFRRVPGLSALAFEIALESERRSDSDAGGAFAPWTHLTFLNDPGIVTARHQVRTTLHVFRRQRLGSLRLDTRLSEGMDRRLSEAARTRSTGWTAIGKLRPLKGWDVEARAESGDRDRAGEGVFAYQTTERELQLRNWVRFDRVWQTGLTVAVGEDREARRSIEARRISIGPEIRRAFRGRGRLTSRFDWTRVAANDALPLFLGLADGHRRGQNYRWRLGLDYRLGQYVDAYVTYDGTIRPERPALHVGRMELRATF